jgi:hypothetical protein
MILEMLAAYDGTLVVPQRRHEVGRFLRDIANPDPGIRT